MKMTLFKSKKKINVTKCIDDIENFVYKEIKRWGFRKYERTLHRFVSDNISQVITFQYGQGYGNETYLMWVNTGIRIPECVKREFQPSLIPKYYHEDDCNIRLCLGIIKNKNTNKAKIYNLKKNKIAVSILEEIVNVVLPVFDIMSNRQAILEHRRVSAFWYT